MSIRILPANHLLLVENGLQDFDDGGPVLAIVDDHASAADQPEPHLTTIALSQPVAGLERELERWVPRIREHSLSDAYEAMRQVLLARGTPESTADRILEDARVLAEQVRVPAGWTAWGAIPPGSLSAFGDGDWLIRWPSTDARKLDAARVNGFSRDEPDDDERVTGPEFTFNAGRPSVPWVKVVRSGLTTAQIALWARCSIAAQKPA